MALKAWIYHETEQPKIVDADKRQPYFDDGWADSPVKFIKIADFAVLPDNEMGIQQLGDAVEGVAKALNGALNIDSMDRDELEDS